MSAMASQITGISIVCLTICSGAYQRKHQSSTSMAFVRGIRRGLPSQRASNAENVSIWWRHYDVFFQHWSCWCNAQLHSQLGSAYVFTRKTPSPTPRQQIMHVTLVRVYSIPLSNNARLVLRDMHKSHGAQCVLLEPRILIFSYSNIDASDITILLFHFSTGTSF